MSVWICVAHHYKHTSSALPRYIRRRWSLLPSPQSDTGLRCKTTDMGCAMCLFTPQAFAAYSFCRPMEGWLRLSRRGSLVLHRGPRWFTHPRMVTHPGTNRARRRLTTLIETMLQPINLKAAIKMVW